MYWQRYVFVAMEGPEGAGLKRLMRAHPVRLFTPEAAEPAGAAGTLDFVTRARTLPAAYWGGGPVSAARWEAWKEAVQASEHAFWPVCLMGATLVYLQELRGTPLLDQHLEELRMQANSKLQASPCPLLFVSVPASAALADDDGQGSALPCLPAEVQRAVLDMLDSVQRAQCRRVCPLWDALIGTEWRVIWVSFAHQRLVDADGKATTPDEAGWQRSAYLVGMCLWKCLRETTQTIVISNAVQQWQNNGLGDCLDLLDWLLREQEWDDDVRVVMQRFHWELDGPLTDELHAAAAAVERVVWLKGTFSGPVEHFRRVPVPLCYSHVDDEDDDEEELPVHADLSHLLEAYLAEPEGEERARLLQWLRDAAEQPADSADRQRIDKILHYCQEQDPRVLAKYGDVAWTVDALQADQLGRLTKLTLCALQREMRAPSADRPAAGSPAYSYGDSPAYSPSSPPPSP
ncbi:uncharacterized protein LOC129601698 [Paramacrobiotus metropolitanus]|uniref:uncharacterized protein LOC129601698 n=1 Tax=Paramacrobiotus metropolitanus TaxID=2943436 RepID=UPI0024465354|nr:uncharacterized protein LOC129601698 [Paramacrobiotus metropolitanus]